MAGQGGGILVIYMLRLAFWVFVLFLALSFFGISVQAIVNSPAGQQNFGYLAYLIVFGINWVWSYLQTVVQRAGF